jgi:hypothetical protein
MHMKKPSFYTLIFTVLFSLTCHGAPAATPAPPAPPYSLKYDFSTDTNYQQVYRTILKNADACSKQGLISKPVTDGQLYTELKAGDIKISILAPFGKYTHIRVGIELVDGQTKVTVSNDFEDWDGLARAIQDWVTNGSTLCK